MTINGYKTEILAASIRSVSHVREAALAGADVSTIPTEIFQKLLSHPLTDKDWPRSWPMQKGKCDHQDVSGHAGGQSAKTMARLAGA